MSIEFRCKSCGYKYQSDDDLSGESFSCKICGTHMQIPHQSVELDSVVADGTEPEILDRTMREPSTGTKSIVKVHSATRAAHKLDDIEFACKICGHKYRLGKEFGGHEAECAKCKRILIIPRRSDNAPEGFQDGKVVFWCKACGQKYRLPENYAGNRAHCSRCKKVFVVPAASENAPPASLSSASDQSIGTITVKPPSSPEYNTWLTSSRPELRPQAVPETKPDMDKTRARVVQDVLTSKSLQTQTSVEITGNPVSMVKYVLASPDRNFVSAAFSALIDWIRQFSIFKSLPRGLIGTAIILFCVTAAAAVAIRYVQQEKKQETRLINTMCLDCKFIEARKLSSISTGHCSKCNGTLGYAWKCFKCGKVFSREVSKADENVLLLENIRPPDCPICASSNVKYIPPEAPPVDKR